MTHPLDGKNFRARLVGPDAPASAPLVDGQLHIGLTVDEGAGPRPVTEADLASWETTLAALMPSALARLVVESGPHGWIPVETVPGMALYQAMDGQSSARALVIGPLVGELPAAGIALSMPSEDQLIVVPLHEIDDVDALNVMIAATRVAWESSDRPLSDQSFWFDGTRWHAIEVVHGADEVTATLPRPLRRALEALAAAGFVAVAAEA